MEALRSLKYWGVNSFGGPSEGNTHAATIVAAAKHDCPSETNVDNDYDNDNDDEGPFFDLEFAISEERNSEHTKQSIDCRVSDMQNEVVERATLSRLNDGMAVRGTAPVPSASKLSIFELGFVNYPKMNSKDKLSKYRTEDEEFVELKIEEVPVVSLIKEECKNMKSQKQDTVGKNTNDSEEKRVPKDIMEKYLKKSIFPRRFMIFPRSGKSMAATTKRQPEMDSFNGTKTGWGILYTNLDEIQSTSSVASVTVTVTSSSMSGRDHSLLQQEDGIQGAILHCKKSFNS